jgi:hypothetical protein
LEVSIRSSWPVLPLPATFHISQSPAKYGWMDEWIASKQASETSCECYTMRVYETRIQIDL